MTQTEDRFFQHTHPPPPLNTSTEITGSLVGRGIFLQALGVQPIFLFPLTGRWQEAGGWVVLFRKLIGTWKCGEGKRLLF